MLCMIIIKLSNCFERYWPNYKETTNDIVQNLHNKLISSSNENNTSLHSFSTAKIYMTGCQTYIVTYKCIQSLTYKQIRCE